MGTCIIANLVIHTSLGSLWWNVLVWMQWRSWRRMTSVYLTDERVVPKYADHTISVLDHYIQHQVPDWVKRLDLWMDNAMTNKNGFVTCWCMEQVCKRRFTSFTNQLMTPGHEIRCWSVVDHYGHESMVTQSSCCSFQCCRHLLFGYMSLEMCWRRLLELHLVCQSLTRHWQCQWRNKLT